MAQQRSPRSNATDSGADALKLLKADHRKVKKLFDEFEEIKDKPRSNQKKGELVRQICAELTLHAEAEEAILYPAARKVIKDEELMDEADVEHAGAKELIAQLEAMDPEDSHYDAKVTVLREYILHHVKEEESEMFPKIEKARLDREKLGDELAHFKEEHEADVESAIHDKR
ncbi:hemerythrin domain-containing protein [Nitrosovibrio sp. Nv17]|uniref:hemerythrin domain-containing protein n=1 Tax=Nitrosovibrio sp. Nv17 TaxID=1855339 RepID=UPI0009087596|nr:hemerythrin domain-containing protein [Nitrosovibrio sp. Nv17]SFW38028.1 Hemerythrin HHE cation binding domain-containing protein [Nitrosovibrio sp. Nv17]